MFAATKKLSELAPQFQKTYKRAQEAVERHNTSYAFDMLRGILRAEPAFDEGRQTLRKAQLQSFESRSALSRQLSSGVGGLKIACKGRSLIKKGKIVEALDLAEELMCNNPTSLPSLSFLADAAEAAEMPHLAIESLEFARKCNVINLASLRRLANLYNTNDEEEKGLEIMKKIVQDYPDDMKAQSDFKQASALFSMKKGKWDKAESYRDVMKDQAEADTLEQKERRSSQTEDSLTVLIRDAEAAVAKQPIVANHKRLAELYCKAKEFDKSIEQYELLVERAGMLDPIIDKAITGVYCARFDDAISQWRAYGDADPAQAEEAENNIREIEEQKTELIYTKAQEQVTRFPNDAGFRFALAELRWQRGEVDAAMKDFQVAQRNPRYEVRAAIYIGKCLLRKGLDEMALEQFQKGLAESPAMDDTRKELLYNLALIYEKMQRNGELLATLKELYAADANYLDVSDRLQACYQAVKQG
jgi:tetratricopeptide (TPR) repeat protein